MSERLTYEDLLTRASRYQKVAEESQRKRQFGEASELAREVVAVGSNASKVGKDTHLVIVGILVEALRARDAAHEEKARTERKLERETFAHQIANAAQKLGARPISK